MQQLVEERPQVLAFELHPVEDREQAYVQMCEAYLSHEGEALQKTYARILDGMALAWKLCDADCERLLAQAQQNKKRAEAARRELVAQVLQGQ